MRANILGTRIVRAATLLAALQVTQCAFAGSEQGAATSTIQYAKIMRGFQDPVDVKIFNQAPAGSDPFHYSVLLSTPIGNSATSFGTKAADGGVSFNTHAYVYDSTNAPLGDNTLTVIVKDTDVPGAQLNQAGTVKVYKNALIGFAMAGGNEVPMSSTPTQPVVQEPPVDPLAFGATGGGESFAAQMPRVINDPPPDLTVAPMDLDSITVTGDPQISITLPLFSDLPPDDAIDSPAYEVHVDTSTPGFFNTEFELNYSEENDIAGAAAPGTEHGFFGLAASVSPVVNGQTQVKVYLVVPEPSALTIAAIPFGAATLRRRWVRSR